MEREREKKKYLPLLLLLFMYNLISQSCLLDVVTNTPGKVSKKQTRGSHVWEVYLTFVLFL